MKVKRIFWIGVLLIGLGGFAGPAKTSSGAAAGTYDLLIKNGLVLDGGLGEPVRADVAVNGDAIARGVRFLLINGVPVVEEGRSNGKLPGKILRLKKKG